VDEVVVPLRSGMDARLRRHLGPAVPLLAERLLESLDDRPHRDAGRLDVGAGQVQDLRTLHDPFLSGGAGVLNPTGRSGPSGPPPLPSASFSPAEWTEGKSSVRIGYGMTIPSRRKRACRRLTNSWRTTAMPAKSRARRFAWS